VATVILACAAPLSAQTTTDIALVVPKGRPLRVVLADTSTVRRVGQTVEGTLLEPVYAYDRVVLPAGARVVGHVARLDNPGKWSRARAWMSGDVSPHRTIVLEFDSIDRPGERLPIETVVTNSVARVKRQVARDAAEDVQKKDGVVARAKQKARETAADAVSSTKQKATDAIAAVKEPGRLERLKVWAVDHLPYHPQFLRKGTVFDAELRAPLTFGTVPPHPAAPEGTTPAPSSVLHARLATTLDSSKAKRGAPLEAVVTEPVFADDGRLIFPEGTKLTGEVTFARPARRFHRNGQLRFLFERVEPPDQESAPLLASLHAIDASGDDRLALDEEGGAGITNSKTRFVAPALALLALRASADQGEGRGFERGANGAGARTTSASVERGHPLGRGLGGFIGFGMLGVGLSQVSRPLGLAFAAVGAARTVYSNILGRGQDVRFQADTPIQVRLAPGPSSDP